MGGVNRGLVGVGEWTGHDVEAGSRGGKDEFGPPEARGVPSRVRPYCRSQDAWSRHSRPRKERLEERKESRKISDVELAWGK